MKKPLVPNGGNDVVITPEWLCKRIIEYLNPIGSVLEPCYGTGNFYNNFPDSCDRYFCEIEMGIDFFDFSKEVDWVITNPPYSKLSKFLEHSFELTNNVAMLILLPNLFQKAKIKLMDKYDFYIDEVVYIDTPREFPAMGFQLGLAIFKRGKQQPIKITDWRQR